MEPIERRVNCRCFAGDPFVLNFQGYDDAAKTIKSTWTGYKVSVVIKSNLDLTDAQAEFLQTIAVQDPANGSGYAGPTSQQTIDLLGDYEYAGIVIDANSQEFVDIYGTVTFEKRPKASLG
jgi:hypothetical protein